jgi:sporulation protein YlmC with PRC-barrel domain
MKLKTVIATVSMLGLLLPAGTWAQSAPRQGQQRQGQQQGKSQQAQTPANEVRVERADTLIGMDVKSQQGETLGEIENLMIDLKDGRVAYAVLDLDGWLDVGGKHVAAPWEALSLKPGTEEVTLKVDKDKLRQAPSFARDYWPTAVERPWLVTVYEFYGQRPYPALTVTTVDKIDVASATAIMDMDVENRQGESLGEVEDLAIDLENGRIAYAVLEFGGWLGLGERLAAVPWGALALNAAEREFTVDTAKDQLKTIPSFARNDWPQTIDRKWLSEVYARYNEKPYWETK